MRIATLTATCLLALSGSFALAETPVQQVHQDNADVHQLNKDIRNNQQDLSKDKQVAADQRADLARDRTDRKADQLREDQDLAKGNYKGASYWNHQRLSENAKVVTEKKDLSHTGSDIKADKLRLAKDLQVRQHDVVKRSRAAGKI